MSFLRDTWLTFDRAVRPALRSPGTLIVGVAVPLVYLVLFGPLLSDTTDESGLSSWQWFVPGMLIQLALFITANAGFSLIPDTRSGVLERMQVTPLSRVALLTGRVLKDVVLLLVQAVLMIGLAFILGFRADVLPILAGLVLLAVTAVAVGFTSYGLALKLKHEFALAPVVSGIVVPLMLLSGVLLPMDRAPDWLYYLSRVNPLSYVVEAERELISGHYDQQVVLIGVAVAIGLLVLSTTWSLRLLRRQLA
ncbi:ABC transporter permease [Micromonospora chokoriensis]|uniref:Transport permease protein n=1 Tax=Micromonospora chokoriensis TaxID=356851 RepID=A0A1C4YMT7_9ACTN|nr:ABC transporter permease [Micromonospora chokoriensis]SCF21990.1 ABC-2 type transport system permease protein [Micromonospora chokoriensis]